MSELGAFKQIDEKEELSRGAFNFQVVDIEYPDGTMAGTRELPEEIGRASSELKLTSNASHPLKESENDQEFSMERFAQAIDFGTGTLSPSFVNGLGSLFLKKVSPLLLSLDSRTNESFDVRFKDAQKVIFVLNDFARVMGPFSEITPVFGKLASIVQNYAYDGFKVDFKNLNTICKKHFNTLAANYKSLINELNSIGVTSVPVFDYSTLVESSDEDDETEVDVVPSEN